MGEPLDLEASDAHLFHRWREGDRTAGEELFTRHFESIYGFFENKVLGDVSDLVQRTFMGCIEARERFRGASSFRTFLFAIARHELYAHYRAQKAGQKLDFEHSSLMDLSPGLSSVLRQATDKALLLDALRALPLEMQIVLELHFWQGLPGADMAEVLEIPEGTVRSRIRRSLERLREVMSQPNFMGLVPQAVDDFDSWAATIQSANPALSETQSPASQRG